VDVTPRSLVAPCPGRRLPAPSAPPHSCVAASTARDFLHPFRRRYPCKTTLPIPPLGDDRIECTRSCLATPSPNLPKQTRGLNTESDSPLASPRPPCVGRQERCEGEEPIRGRQEARAGAQDGAARACPPEIRGSPCFLCDGCGYRQPRRDCRDREGKIHSTVSLRNSRLQWTTPPPAWFGRVERFGHRCVVRR